MKRLSLLLSALWLTISLAIACTDVSEGIKNKMMENMVAVTGTVNQLFGQGEMGGQGTIIKDSKEGAIVLTAGHVSNDGSSNPTIVTRDGKLHEAVPHWSSKKEDLAEFLIKGYHHRTHATIGELKEGMSIYTFGYVDYQPYYLDGEIINFVFTFSEEMYQGHMGPKIPQPALIGYPIGHENMYLAHIFADHGSSGEGVYDKDGNLVGVISAGNGMRHRATYVVDVKTSLDEKEKDAGKDMFEKEPTLKDLIDAVKNKGKDRAKDSKKK